MMSRRPCPVPVPAGTRRSSRITGTPSWCARPAPRSGRRVA